MGQRGASSQSWGQNGPWGTYAVWFGLCEASSFPCVLGMSCSVALWPWQGRVPSCCCRPAVVCPHPLWPCALQPAGGWSPQGRRLISGAEAMFFLMLCFNVTVMHLDILKPQKLWRQFCPVGCISVLPPCPGECRRGGRRRDAECAGATWPRTLGASLFFPPEISWRLAGPRGLQGKVYCRCLAEATVSPAHTGQDTPAGIS